MTPIQARLLSVILRLFPLVCLCARYARSPFVNSLLNKLKGHHASLVGCQAVEGTPELITADTSGVVKVP